MSTLLIFLFVIIILVVGHELGHFFVAKAFGIRVDEFGLGYPPRAKKLFTWRGTLFTLNWLPFGGFVKIFGEDDGGKSADTKSDSFAHQKLWKRLLVLVAGIAANFVLAVVLYALSFSVGFLGNANDFPHAKIIGHQDLTITEVLKGTPAYDSGIKTGDKITSVIKADDDVVTTPNDVNDFIHFVQSNENKKINIGVLREGKEQFFTVTPQKNIVNDKPGIGVGIEKIGLLQMNFFRAFGYAFVYTINQFLLILVSLGALVAGLFSGNGGVVADLSGPVGIAKFAGTAYSMGIGSLLSFMGVISINLAVVNLLPFPALDGGRMILEFFASKGQSKISQKIVSSINQIGFLILIILMLWVTYHDIFKSL